MTCDEARLLIGADPATSTPELEEHVRGCPACARFRTEMRSLDADIHRAMQEPPQVVRPAARAMAPAWRQWAMAAGAALATFLVLSLWVLRPSDTLAQDVVRHVQGEPESWMATRQVSAGELQSALQNAGVALNVTSDQVVYAQSCWFRGHYVPHLVVQTAQGPVTVMILRHDRVRSRLRRTEPLLRLLPWARPWEPQQGLALLRDNDVGLMLRRPRVAGGSLCVIWLASAP